MTVHTDSIILLPQWTGGDKVLHLLIKEYLAVCEYLMLLEARKQTPDTLPALRKGNLLVDKGMLMELLDRNKYETASNKLKVWKELAWIDAEENRLTRRVYWNKSYKALIVINVSRYECIRELSREIKTL